MTHTLSFTYSKKENLNIAFIPLLNELLAQLVLKSFAFTEYYVVSFKTTKDLEKFS